jgi:hypothetical protein
LLKQYQLHGKAKDDDLEIIKENLQKIGAKGSGILHIDQKLD